MEEIIKIIKQELKNRNITYYEFSRMTNIPTGTLRNIFSNRGINPRIDTINAMLNALGINQYEKTPQGTVLTELEREIMDIITDCSEHEQQMIRAYALGLKDSHNISNKVVKPDTDNYKKLG